MPATNRSRAQIRITRERSRPHFLLLGILITIAYAGFNWVAAVEVATLHPIPPTAPARVFVVDDPPFVWVRAERSDRDWLQAIEAHAQVRLARGDREIHYYAIVSNRESTNEEIAALFREKYGFLDTLWGWWSDRDAVTIRLEPEFY